MSAKDGRKVKARGLTRVSIRQGTKSVIRNKRKNRR